MHLGLFLMLGLFVGMGFLEAEVTSTGSTSGTHYVVLLATGLNT